MTSISSPTSNFQNSVPNQHLTESGKLPPIGSHLSINNNSGVCGVIERSLSIGCKTSQVFISNPKSWKCATVDDKDCERTQKLIQDNNFQLFIHGKYIYNFCRDKEQQRIALLSELNAADKLNAEGVVIHQGKNCKDLNIDDTSALNNFITEIVRVLDKFFNDRGSAYNVPLLILENSARQGNELGYNLEQLTYIWNNLHDDIKPYIGFCLDTCHAFVAGEIDFRDSNQIVNWLQNFDANIGLKKMTLIHLNDSKIQFGYKNDHHENLFEGYIGTEFQYSISKLLKYSIPLVTETPNTDRSGEFQNIINCYN